MTDWAVHVSKKGKIVNVGDLHSYVKSYIDSGDFEETKKNYKVPCPYCKEAYKIDPSYSGPYLKKKLHVSKDFKFGHCFRCDGIYLDEDDSLNTDVSLPQIMKIDEFKLVKLSGKNWNLELFNTFDDYDEKGYRYLVNKRHYHMSKLYKLLKIKFTNSNPVIPFYYRGELIYYQIKMINNSNIPYFSPPITHKPAYVIEHGDNKRFVLCEGVFDAIACLILFPDRTPFCLLGSHITDYQIWMLRSYVPEDILIYMDYTELSNGVAESISEVLNYCNIDIHPSNGQDPEERLKEIIAEDSI